MLRGQKYTIQVFPKHNVYILFIKYFPEREQKKNPGQNDRGVFFELGR
jgi:hypothetical protein